MFFFLEQFFVGDIAAFTQELTNFLQPGAVDRQRLGYKTADRECRTRAFAAVKGLGDLPAICVVSVWNDLRNHRRIRLSHANKTRRTAKRLDWNSDARHNVFQYLIRLFGLFQGRGVEVVDNHSVGKDRNYQRLEIVWNAIRAAFEESHRLRCAI